MNYLVFFILFNLFTFTFIKTQDFSEYQDQNLNNLVHPVGYKTCKIGELGNVQKSGNGEKSLIIIAGMGFSSIDYEELAGYYEKEYKVFRVTPAGFGGTPAPDMPDTSIKYSELTWTYGIVEGVINLIQKEKLVEPTIITHFITGTQVGIILLLEHSDIIGKVIILGGSPYRFYAGYKDGQWDDWDNEMKITLSQRIEMTESYWAPKWFKTVTKKTWDSFMWTPDDYTKDSTKGKLLFDKSALVPIQVMIRYILEWGAFDPSENFNFISKPLLILIPDFKEILTPVDKNDAESCNKVNAKKYLKGFHQDAWKPAEESSNPKIQIKEVEGTRLFMWLDKPEETFRLITQFLNNQIIK